MNALQQLQGFLICRPGGVPAKLLADLQDCSIPTVYRRIEKLQAAGARIKTVSAPNGNTGPVPVKFKLVKRADL